MHVRLAFSVMIQVDADILLIDEVLAVGDAAFQQKCFDEFNRLRDEGKTIVLRHARHGRGQPLLPSRDADRARQGRRASASPSASATQYLELNFARAGAPALGAAARGATRYGDGARADRRRLARGRAAGAPRRSASRTTRDRLKARVEFARAHGAPVGRRRVRERGPARTSFSLDDDPGATSRPARSRPATRRRFTRALRQRLRPGPLRAARDRRPRAARGAELVDRASSRRSFVVDRRPIVSGGHRRPAARARRSSARRAPEPSPRPR